MRKLFGALTLLALSGCANQLDPKTQVYEMQLAYTTGVSGEMAWIATAKPSQSDIAKAQAARIKAFNAIEPLVAEVETGTIPSSAVIVDAQVAVDAFQALVPTVATTTATTSTTGAAK